MVGMKDILYNKPISITEFFFQFFFILPEFQLHEGRDFCQF